MREIKEKKPEETIVLGIESTAHTFGVGIIRGREVLANERFSFVSQESGMIPWQVANQHYINYMNVLKKALQKAKLGWKDIDLISFSRGPGIGQCLKIGATVAKSLSLNLNIPLIGINHCIAHLNVGKMYYPEIKDPLLLYLSGANTQVIAYEANKYRIFGETLDMGIGNFLDSFARLLGLGFPGGPKIYELALKGNNYVELPYSVKGMDVSFGGIFTNLKQKIGKYSKEDLCYSVQETVFAMMIEVAERAMAHTNKQELLLGGGVACNLRLQEMAKKMTSARNAKLYVLPNSLNVDNGVMIAWEGLIEYFAGEDIITKIRPYERTDDIEFKHNLSEVVSQLFSEK